MTAGETVCSPPAVDLFKVTGHCQVVDAPLSALNINLSDSMSIRRAKRGHFSDKEFENQAPPLTRATRSDVRTESPDNSAR